MIANQMKTLDRVKAHFKAYKVEFIQTGVYIAYKVLPYQIDELKAIEHITINGLLDLNTINTNTWSSYFYDWLDDISKAMNQQIMKTGKRPDKVIFTYDEYLSLYSNKFTLERCHSVGAIDLNHTVKGILSNFGIKEMIVLDVEYKE